MINLAAHETGFSSPEWDPVELTIVFLGPRKTRQINRAFLGHDYVTDVITFDWRTAEAAAETDACLGEILVCPAKSLENAAEFDTSPAWELTLYIVHGLLHLGGWDDHSPGEVAAMRKAENRVMERLSQRFDVCECFEFGYMSEARCSRRHDF